MHRSRVKKYCKQIAKMYGANLRWINSSMGWYEGGNKISVGVKPTVEYMVCIFCHELAHYLNYIEGKYPLYHYADGYGSFTFFRKFKSPRLAAAYAHRAEVFTEKVGESLCVLYFPYVKYTYFYKTGDERSLNFVIDRITKHW